MPFIQTVPEGEATGQLADLYQRLSYQDGSVDESFKALSLNPSLLGADAALYDITMYGESPLTRSERELLALTVSRLNGCERCIRHHTARYDTLVGRPTSGARGEASAPDRDTRESSLVAFAEKLTRDPAAIKHTDIHQLRQAGLDDRGVLDACNTIAYFNYANRMTLGLGLAPEDGPPGVRDSQAI